MRTACPKTIAMIERCGRHQNQDIPVDYTAFIYGATEWYPGTAPSLPPTDRGRDDVIREETFWG